MISSPLLTYQDVYEHLLDVFNQSGKNVRQQDRRLRRAIVEAYRILPSLHDWEYYRRTGMFVTDPAESVSGTYTASDKRVTLSSGQWNSNAAFGSVRIENIRYRIIRRVSDTVVELEGGPDSDVTGEFEWRRYRYLLPVDVGDVTQVIDPRQYFDIRRASPEETFWWQEAITTETFPISWSIFPSRESPGRLEIWLSGSGITERTLKFLYRARHTGLPVLEESDGTVSISGDVATFDSQTIDSSMIGAVLRIGNSSSTEPPTSEYGRMVRDRVTGEERTVVNPPEYEMLITQVLDGSNAVVSSSFSSGVVSDRKFTISSHVNVNYEGMWELLLRLAEERYAIVTWADTPIRNIAYSNRMQAMRTAMIADGPGRSSYTPNRFRGEIILETP